MNNIDKTNNRKQEIKNAKSKRHLSNNPKTQSAINWVRGFGIMLNIYGVIFAILTIYYIIGSTIPTGGENWAPLGVIIYAPIAIYFFALGVPFYRLSSPKTILVSSIFNFAIAMVYLHIIIYRVAVKNSSIYLETIFFQIVPMLISILFPLIIFTKYKTYKMWYYKQIN